MDLIVRRLRQALLTVLVAMGGVTASYAQTLVFSAIPDQDERLLEKRFSKVADYLARELQVDVKYLPVNSYAAAVTAFRNNQVQLAWFGGFSGVQARRMVANSVAIAQGAEDTEFRSYVIAHRSTGLHPADTLPEAMRGLRFTFGSKSSTSGRLMPEWFLREHFKEAPDKIFSRVGFSGDHSRTIALVESGAFDVGAVNYSVWDRAVADGKVDTDKVQVIWTTPSYTDYQWTVRGDIDARMGAGFTEKLRKALLTMNEPELLAAFPRSAFIPATNADYAAIEATAEAIGLMDKR